MERDFLFAIGRKQRGAEAAKDETTRAEPADCPGGGGGATAMQWQFPAKSGAAPAIMSFRTAATREEGTKEFSISGFRPPATGDAFDGIKKHASSPVTSQQRQFGFDAPVTTQQYGHRAPVSDHGAATHHLLGASRMVQPLSSRHPVPFNQANGMPRTQQNLHNGSNGGMFKSQPFAISNGFGGSTVGAYGARNPRSQTSTQLTIFYNGTVNVFDNVSVEKAQELMLLASKASVVSSPPSVVRKPDSSISAPAKINVPEVLPPRQIVTQKPAKINVPEVLPPRQIVTQKPEPSVSHLATSSSPISVKPQSVASHLATSSNPISIMPQSVASHLATSSNPISVMPQSVALPRSMSNCTTDSTKPKTVIQPPVIVPTSQASSSQATPLATTSSAAVMPRAVPQARKASLARFLEKRKERVTSVEPYPTSKSPIESSDLKSSSSALSKSPFDLAARNNGKEPLSFGQPRNISFSSEACPNTRLQI